MFRLGISITASVVILLALTKENLMMPEKRYMTQYAKNFTFSCPDGHALKSIESMDQRGPDDRIWHFDCHDLEEIQITQCDWSGYQNQVHKPLNFKCGNDRVVAGVQTNFSDRYNDRSWSFRCCSLNPSYIIHACDYTPWLNDPDKPLNYHSPAGYLISGMVSEFADHNQDRQWKVDHCKLSQIMSVVG